MNCSPRFHPSVAANGASGGTTVGSDYLSLIMFEPEYLRTLIEIGEADAEANFERIAEVLQKSPAAVGQG